MPLLHGLLTAFLCSCGAWPIYGGHFQALSLVRKPSSYTGYNFKIAKNLKISGKVKREEVKYNCTRFKTKLKTGLEQKVLFEQVYPDPEEWRCFLQVNVHRNALRKILPSRLLLSKSAHQKAWLLIWDVSLCFLITFSFFSHPAL